MPTAEATQVQTAFAAGELSPRLRGRTDLRQYFDGCATLENFIVSRHGGASKRPGTRFVAEAKDSDSRIRLVEFSFSDLEQYVLEFGEGYIRFYRYDANGDPLQLDDAGTPTEIATTYTTAQLPFVKFAQSADILFIVHPAHPPRTLVRAAPADTLPASWVLSDFIFIDGPYDDINTTAITLTPAAASGFDIVLTASAATFSAADEGRWVRILHDGTWGSAKIDQFINATTVTIDIQSAFGATTASADWRLGSWHSTSGHYPSVVSFHEGRLWFAASTAEPQTVWASRSMEFDVFSPSEPNGDVTDSVGLDLDIDDDKANIIRWLVSDRFGLVVLTTGSEFAIRGANDGPITATTAHAKRQSRHGAHTSSRPHQIDQSIVYWQPGRHCREMVYSIETDRLGGPDLAILSEHIMVAGSEETAYQELPDSILWTVRSDGQLVGATLERDQKMVCWHRHLLGGDGFVESVAVIRTVRRDQVWLSVLRTIGGVTRRYVEVMQDVITADTEHEDAWPLDCALRYEGVATDVIAGLEHLEGAVVTTFGNGATIPDEVVTAGEIEIDSEVTKAVVGFGFDAKLQTMPLAPQAPYEGRGKFRRATQMFIQLWRSLGGSAGNTEDNVDPLIYRTPSVAMNEPPPLFTGVKELRVDGSFDREQTLWLVHSEPQPFNLLALIMEVDLGGR